MNKTIKLENTTTKLKTHTDIRLDTLEEKVAKLEKAVFGNKKEDKKEILYNVEKEYLSAVIKPFRDEIEFIMKDEAFDYSEFIEINLKDGNYICFPYFKKGTMYAGMERCKKYNLKELRL